MQKIKDPTLSELSDMHKLAVITGYIPVEMYWAYEAVRQSGLYNMLCFHPVVGRYSSNDPKECLDIMDKIYVKLCAYNNANIEDKQYVHMTKDHVKIIQELYSTLAEYYEPLPEGIVTLKKEVSTKFSF